MVILVTQSFFDVLCIVVNALRVPRLGHFALAHKTWSLAVILENIG